MSASQKLYAIKDASDIQIDNISDGSFVAFMNYANKFTIKMSSEMQYSKSKGANSVAFASPFEGTLTTEFDNVSLAMLAMLLGSEVISTSSGEIAKRENHVVSSAGTVELTETPKTGSITAILTAGDRTALKAGSVASATEFSVTGKTLTFDNAMKGKDIVVTYIKSSASIDSITVYATPRTKAYKMTAFTSIKAEEDLSDEDLVINLYKVSPKPSSELTFDASNPSTFSIEWDILKNSSDKMLELVKEQ